MVDFEPVKILSNIFIAFIGSGVLGLPYAFKRSGLLEGAFVMAAVAYFSMKAMLLLIDCQYKVKSVLHSRSFPEESEAFMKIENGSINKSNGNSSRSGNSNSSSIKMHHHNNDNHDVITYSDVAFAAWGPLGRLVVDSSLVCAQIGFCCGYLIFITENLHDFMPIVPKTQWLIFILPPLFFLTLIPDLGKLAVFSLLAQVSNLVAFAVVYWFDFQHLHLAQAWSSRTECSLKGFPFFFCAAVYCFEGAGMILSLEQSVPPSRRPQFKKYFVATIICITSLYISFGASGYLSFGPETKDIITLNLESSAGSGAVIDFAVLVKLFLCISLFFSYPIMLFPVTRMLQRKHAAFKGLPPSSPSKTPTTHFTPLMIRLIIVTLSGFIVCIIPNFSDLMNIIGAVFGTILAFIMPALCHYAIFRKSIRRSDLVWDCLLVVVGCMGCLLGLIEAFGNDYEEGQLELASSSGVIAASSKLQASASHLAAPNSALASSDDAAANSNNNLVIQTEAAAAAAVTVTAAAAQKIANFVSNVSQAVAGQPAAAAAAAAETAAVHATS